MHQISAASKPAVWFTAISRTSSLAFGVALVGAALFLASFLAVAQANSDQAQATLQAKSGSNVSGTVTLRQTDSGLRIKADVSGLTPNTEHGFHIHAVDNCNTPDAASAGPHFNPTDKPHGQAESIHSHAGDLPNLRANDQGVATLTTVSPTVSLNPGQANNVMGRTVVVHADPDDHHSQPAGNAGARVACGVIVAND